MLSSISIRLHYCHYKLFTDLPFLFFLIFIYLFGHTGSLVAACGTYFSNQGLNPGLLHWEFKSLNHWTIREIPLVLHLD